MAKIIEQHVVIRLSKLTKDNEDESANFLDKDTVKALEDVVKELTNDPAIVIEVVDE